MPTWGMRERVLLHVAPAGEDYRIGLIRDDAVLEIPDCPAHSPKVNRVIARLRATFPRGLPLRFVHRNEQLLTVVLKARREQGTHARLRAWAGAFLNSDVRGIFVNYHPSAGDRVFASRAWELLAGKPEATFFDPEGVPFRYGPASFLQNHRPLYFDALRRARAHFAEKALRGTFFDLYCGIGVTASALGAGEFPELISVELSGDSLRFARENAGAHGNQVIFRGKVEERIPQLDAVIARATSAVVFLNPSRSGLDPDVVAWLACGRAKTKRIAYLSCNVGTLARDLALLASAGYAVSEITPYDFFPMTGHLENLALLT